MAFSAQMPALGESVTEGTVTRWLKQEGDTVDLNEPLVEVSTDKVDTEIPSPGARVLKKIIAQEDATVPVGGELARIGVGADAAAASASTPPPALTPEPKPEPQPVSRADVAANPAPAPQTGTAQAQPAAVTDGDGAPYVTPLVRKLATRHNIDLAEVNGSGAGGRIREQDVLAAAQEIEEAKKAPAQAPAAAPAADSGKAARA